MSHKRNDVITIKNDALEALSRYGIDEEFAIQMVGKSFVVKYVEGDCVIEACGIDWYIPDDAICDAEIDPSIVKDFLNLL